MWERYFDHLQKEIRDIHSDLTIGSIIGTVLRFTLPMITGNLLQQFYSIADTLIVGRYLGVQALAATGVAYTLMSSLTSILLGLCMGSGAVFSLRYGEENEGMLEPSMFMSFVPVTAAVLVLGTAVFLFTDPVMYLLCVPVEIYGFMGEYLQVILFGTSAVFLYNYFARLLRVVGNSFIPLVFLGISALLNVGLNLVLVLVFRWGVTDAGVTTAVPQFVPGIGICLYTYLKIPEFKIDRNYMKMDRKVLTGISGFSFLIHVQQSVMNFGILMVQGLVNSFGAVVMAAFTAIVRVDPFAYMPVQDFENAFSTFIVQNYGTGRHDRVEKGIKSAITASALFCLATSFTICIFAGELILVFIQPQGAGILAVGVQRPRIEGIFYCGIGYLLLLYGLHRVMRKPEMSVVPAIISLGTGVVLAYILSAIPGIGIVGVWVSVSTGWFLVGCTGSAYYWVKRRVILGQGGNRGE